MFTSKARIIGMIAKGNSTDWIVEVENWPEGHHAALSIPLGTIALDSCSIVGNPKVGLNGVVVFQTQDTLEKDTLTLESSH